MLGLEVTPFFKGGLFRENKMDKMDNELLVGWHFVMAITHTIGYHYPYNRVLLCKHNNTYMNFVTNCYPYKNNSPTYFMTPYIYFFFFILQIIFSGIGGSSYNGDIALDHIMLFSGECGRFI